MGAEFLAAWNEAAARVPKIETTLHTPLLLLILQKLQLQGKPLWSNSVKLKVLLFVPLLVEVCCQLQQCLHLYTPSCTLQEHPTKDMYSMVAFLHLLQVFHNMYKKLDIELFGKTDSTIDYILFEK